jgi:non-specific serine/threonine protein kinase
LLAVNFAEAGRDEDAVREANMAMTLRPDESTVLYNVACIFGLMKKKDKAMDALRKAWKAGFTDSAWVRRDSDLAILHDEAEFDELYPPLAD